MTVQSLPPSVSEDKWAASYRIWAQVYDTPEAIARAVVREKISHAISNSKLLKELGDQYS
jgi:hypothetical protein